MDDQHHLKSITTALHTADDSERAELLRHPTRVDCTSIAVRSAGEAARAAMVTITGARLDAVPGGQEVGPLDEAAIKRLAMMTAASRSSSDLVCALRLWSCYRVLRMVEPPTPEYPL